MSENTVLVIQQLFSNFLSALFIPFFKAVRDFGVEDENEEERPQYVFSFYLLILIHASAAVIFTTFNGRYSRLEHENQKNKERRKHQYADVDYERNLNVRRHVDMQHKRRSASQRQQYFGQESYDEEQQVFLEK